MAYQLDQARILIVDDMQPMLDLTKSILNIFGFTQVWSAPNAEEGFELVCSQDPDLVITDWMMEPIDGLEFTKKIRTSPLSPNPYVPVIMMTGFSSRLRVEEARDSGITEFLVKPFSSKDLYSRVHQIIEKPRQFVDADNFFGPDRRRKIVKDYEGPKRRGEETRKSSKKGEDKAMSDILKKLRDDAKSI